MKKQIRIQICKSEHDKALAAKNQTGYKLSKIYQMAFSLGINQLKK